MTPLPRTVSKVPERLKIRQCLSRSCTDSSPKFSSRIQYRHYTDLKTHLPGRYKWKPNAIQNSPKRRLNFETHDTPYKRELQWRGHSLLFLYERLITPAKDDSFLAMPSKSPALQTVGLHSIEGIRIIKRWKFPIVEIEFSLRGKRKPLSGSGIRNFSNSSWHKGWCSLVRYGKTSSCAT